METSTPSTGAGAGMTAGQKTKLERLLQDVAKNAYTLALAKVEAGKEGWQMALGRGDELKKDFAEFAVAKLRDLSATGYALARLVLGDDFISPEEVMKARPEVVYSPEQIALFRDSLPPRGELEWLRERNYMLVAGPPKPISLLEIRDLKPDYFYAKTGGWYAEEREKFSREEKAPTAWHELKKEVVSNSRSKSWDEQLPLLGKDERVPNDAELEWGVTTYKAVRNIRLFPDVYARTSSRDSSGYHVDVGNFGHDGLYVDSHGGWPVLPHRYGRCSEALNLELSRV